MTPNPLPPSTVIYMTAEDGLADTLKPRLEAAGADCSKVAVLRGFTEVYDGNEVARAFTLTDVDMLEEALSQTRAKLIIIDPLQGFLGGEVDMHRANEVRPILSGIGKLAEQHGCAILGIRHLGKSSKNGSLHRGLGSVDFTAFARSQLLIGKYNDQRVITHSKSSLAPKGRSLAYDIIDGALVWRGISDATPDDVASTFVKLKLTNNQIN